MTNVTTYILRGIYITLFPPPGLGKKNEKTCLGKKNEEREKRKRGKKEKNGGKRKKGENGEKRGKMGENMKKKVKKARRTPQNWGKK